ncbi:MAG: hypothetical protein AB7S81_02475 [Bdellovibrionales bacterium]
MSLPDFEEFRPYMDGFNMTDEEKDEVTMALWKIAQHFVDQAFGRTPVEIINNMKKQPLDP